MFGMATIMLGIGPHSSFLRFRQWPLKANDRRFELLNWVTGNNAVSLEFIASLCLSVSFL